MKKLFAILFGYFFRGLLFTVPTAVTIYVIVELFRFIDGLLVKFLGAYLPPYGLVPGLGMLTLFLVITLLGLFASSVIAQPLIRSFARTLDRAPLIKTIYSAIRDLLSAFVGKEKRFDRPVLVRLGRELEVERLGFVTRSDLSVLGIGPERVAVYLPHAYAWSGNLVIVPRDNVTPISVKPAEAMKFIVSGGVSDVAPTKPPAEKAVK